MTLLRAGEATRVGQVRPGNQDNLVVAEDKQLFAVADGMGGHRGGEVASEVAAETLVERFTEHSTEGLANAVQASNEAVVSTADGDSSLKGMGTTLCALALVEVDGSERLAVANVGDSRLYLLKSGTEHLEQVTEDHSLVETLYRQGQLTRAEAEVHPHRNILTRALGIDTDVLVDLFELAPMAGDRYLICSDGLFNEVTEEHMSIVLRQNEDPQTAADELARLADEAGGRDNITVVVVDVVRDADDSTEAGDPEVERIVKVERANEDPIDFPSRDSGGDGARPAQQPPSSPPSPPAGGTDATAPQPMVPGPDGQPIPAPPQHQSPTGGSGAGTAAGGGAPVIVDPALAAPTTGGSPPQAVGQPRTRFTWRVAVFLVAFAALVGAVALAFVYTGKSGYYVAIQGDEVVVYQGQPGGVLFVKPTVLETTSIRFGDVPPEMRPNVEKGQKFDSQAEAEAFVQAIRNRQAEIRNSLGAAVPSEETEDGGPVSTSPPGSQPVGTTHPPPAATTPDGGPGLNRTGLAVGGGPDGVDHFLRSS